jgi:glyoxylase-like metal-dependent hydrolase (beta-lactamase superfamily II)
MKIGRYEVSFVETCRFALDGGAMFGVVPKKLWSKAYPHVDDENRIAMAARALLIRGDGRTVVVDAGCGHKMGEKLDAIYGVDHSRYTLIDGLAELGVAPEEVDHFIYTHLHFDHAGGATRLDDNGTAVPLFANAQHYVQRDHLTWARNPTDKDRASFMPENWEPVVERGLLEELEGPGEVLPGIEVRPLFGHTCAMQSVIIHGDDGEGMIPGLYYPADLFPTSAHLSYPYIMSYDNFPLTTLDEKRKILPEVYERGWHICFEHDAFTETAQIAPGKRGFDIIEASNVAE